MRGAARGGGGRAAVLLHDRLVAPELLEEVPAGALRFDVGKESGNHRCPQEEINALLVAHARAGRVVVRPKGGDPSVFGRGPEGESGALLVARARAGRVGVRLRGGDPFVFGRGAEEALACADAGVAWEVVPGVTSAVSVPARAGIPVTHRGVATSFAVVTGHCLGDDRVETGRAAQQACRD